MDSKKKLSFSEKKILAQMIIMQRANINKDYKLSISNIIKIIKNIDTQTSPFDNNNCCIWKGYHISNEKNDTKYTNFYLNNKKIALNRLLYINYINDLQENSYLKYNCENKGICCNLKHIELPNTNNKHDIFKVSIDKNNDKIIINFND